MADDSKNRHRVDHWLKLCCIYKQRNEATKACDSGHVKINGTRAKPSADVKIGDTIQITGVRERKLVVLGLPSGNVSKEAARELYRDETPPPVPQTDGDWIAHALRNAPKRERGLGRPTKRDRRDIERFERD